MTATPVSEIRDLVPNDAAPGERAEAVMFAPSALGGHARYAQAILSAMADVGGRRGYRTGLISSVDLSPQHRTSAYPIHAVLPRLAFREEFAGRLPWAVSRLTHYPRRDGELLRWLDGRRGLRLMHFQERSPFQGRKLYEAIRRRNVAVVETVHNIVPHRALNRWHLAFESRCSRAAWRAAAALIVHTEKLRDDLSECLGPGHPPIHVAPHGVWDVPPTAEKTAPGDPPRLLFFGIIRANKGLDVLVRAMSRLPECRLTVAGCPDGVAQATGVRSLINGLPAHQVRYIEKFVDDDEAAALFDEADLVVLPYTGFASQSGVLHQAVAHGRPVVASDVGALGESVRAWCAGIVVPPADPESLAEGICAALAAENYASFARGAVRAREGRSWGEAAEATFDVYDEILGRRSQTNSAGT